MFIQFTADQLKIIGSNPSLEPPVYTFEQKCLNWLHRPRCHLRKAIHRFIHST